MRQRDIADAIWKLFQAEIPNGSTEQFRAWVQAAKAHQPKLLPIPASIAIAFPVYQQQ